MTIGWSFLVLEETVRTFQKLIISIN